MIHLRIETDEDGKSAVFSWSRDGQEYNKTAEADTQILTDEHCVGFTGAHFGIYCHDMDTQSNYADFKYFRVLESGNDRLCIRTDSKAGRMIRFLCTGTL